MQSDATSSGAFIDSWLFSFFPFLSHLSLQQMPTPLWLIVFLLFPDDATSSGAFIGANAPLVDCFFL